MRPFEEIVVEHGAVVMRVCRAVVGAVDAEDAWSDTFLSAMRAYPGLRPDSNVRAWLVTIAHNKAIDLIRTARRAPRLGEELPEAPSPAVPGPLDDDLSAALGALSPKQRGAVMYHYLADLPYAEVGVVLGISEPAARRRAADGIANLRKTLWKDKDDEH